MALVIPMCPAVASPDTIHPPSGNSQICVDVQCSAPTTIVVRYRIPDASAKFCDGSIDVGPFEHNCNAGSNRICQDLCFSVTSNNGTFPVDVVIKEKDALSGGFCPVNLIVR